MNKRTTCIVCKSTLYEDVVLVGEQFPSAVYPKDILDYSEIIQKTCLNVTQCRSESCNLVQLSHSYNLDLVFKYYPYLSGATATMKEILKDVVDEAEKVKPLNSRSTVLDIGGNDGTMLSLVNSNVRHKVNMDAAHGITSVLNDKNYQRVEGHFSTASYKKLNLPGPDLIFSVAMFYHLDNPLSFCRDVESVMDSESVWCLQMTYLGSMVKDNIYDNIVHEHVAYYSLQSLENLLLLAGLKVFHAKVVDSYGGSIRAFIQKKSSPVYRPDSQELKELRAQEKKENLASIQTLKIFNERMQLLRVVTKKWIDQIVHEHGPIMALGASTKGNMLCQFLEIGKEQVSVVLDNSEKKIGSILVGSNIPIVDEAQYFSKMPKYVLVLPYYYTSFFKKLLANKNSSAEYIFVPLPYPHCIKIKEG